MRPRTASGRDAMLRTAAEAAVDAAMEQSGAQLGGVPPAAFITGLAGDLGAQSPAARGVSSAMGVMYPYVFLWCISNRRSNHQDKFLVLRVQMCQKRRPQT